MTTDKAKFYPAVIEELAPQAFHDTEKYSNNRIEADHGRFKARTRPMRGLKTDPTATVIVKAHAFIQNLRRGFYELAVDVRPKDRLVASFAELATAI